MPVLHHLSTEHHYPHTHLPCQVRSAAFTPSTRLRLCTGYSCRQYTWDTRGRRVPYTGAGRVLADLGPRQPDAATPRYTIVQTRTVVISLIYSVLPN